MKFSIHVDPERRRATLAGSGRFDLRAIAQSMVDVTSYPDFEVHFGILVDLRSMEPGPPTYEEIEAISRMLEGYRQASRGPIALLARPGTLYDMTRLTAEQASARGVRMRAFLGLAELDEWLTREIREPEYFAAWRDFVSAVEAGDLAAVDAALARTPELAGEVDTRGVSLLRLANHRRHYPIVERLRGARPQLDLIDACALGDLDRVRYLCAEDPLRVGIEAADHATPLGLAAHHGHLDVAVHLLACGADPARAGTRGFTALHRAAAAGHCALVVLLLEAGAPREPRNEAGETPLDLARAAGHAALVARLGGDLG